MSGLSDGALAKAAPGKFSPKPLGFDSLFTNLPNLGNEIKDLFDKLHQISHEDCPRGN